MGRVAVLCLMIVARCVALGLLRVRLEQPTIRCFDLSEPLDFLDYASGVSKSRFANNEWLIEKHAYSDVSGAQVINDRKNMEASRRENLLKELFAKHGCKLIFRNY